MRIHLPTLTTGERALDLAFQIALGDLAGNVRRHQSGALQRPAPVLMAGLEYGVWTRDAAINAWNGAGLIAPTIDRDTLRATLTDGPEGPRAGGQYWDAIIWLTGAWAHYLYTGDLDFLGESQRVAVQTLAYFEASQFDPADGLFRGAACYGDGVSAYPDRYVHPGGCIGHWHPRGAPHAPESLPMKTLSTNVLYLLGYEAAGAMQTALGRSGGARYDEKAAALRAAIRTAFWDDHAGRLRYLVDGEGRDEAQEGLGVSFALLAGILSPAESERLWAGLHRAPAGLPCLWPPYDRYGPSGEMGRHCGPVWPHVNGFLAEAAARAGQASIFEDELRALATKALRDGHFYEIYHPETGAPYGGVQELVVGEPKDWHGWCLAGAAGTSALGHELHLWHPARRQTWCATAYLRMVLQGLLGMRFAPEGITFAPCLPVGLDRARVEGLAYRDAQLTIEVERGGATDGACLTLDRQPVERIPATLEGTHRIGVLCP